MRITHRAVTQTALLGLNGNLAAVAKLQQQLTSGKQISAPSDSPTDTNRAMQVRQDRSAAQQYARNITDGRSRLDAADTALATMAGQVRRVRDLTVQGLNSGSMSTTSRQAISIEVGALRQSLLAMANSSINGRPLFGGPTSGATAYDAATGDYVGARGAGGEVVETTRRISRDEVARVDVTGPEAFGDPDGEDLFALVAKIADDVVADPDQLSADLAGLDAALDRLLGAGTAVGARSARLEAAGQVNADQQLALRSQLAGVEDIDLAKTIMDLNQRQVGYQAALQATANVIQPTLVDFLR
ncbi:flagellar hook-associated protein 3 FlgL [Geodermatophilus pulveris]|uniref:Flagellin n=1 Tax=Geodermatophilus pulveris TaxID=1564159 RepID=A0A239GPS8_9ACTN|nr:flagellin [Geodermatophilus pulveris]SNS71226.1 flagellar hook-associated protein 3 FlgL [Geodermatophilus pulveris]